MGKASPNEALNSVGAQQCNNLFCDFRREIRGRGTLLSESTYNFLLSFNRNGAVTADCCQYAVMAHVLGPRFQLLRAQLEFVSKLRQRVPDRMRFEIGQLNSSIGRFEGSSD